MPGSTTSIDDLRKLFLLGSMLDYTRFTEVRCGGQYIYLYCTHVYVCQSRSPRSRSSLASSLYSRAKPDNGLLPPPVQVDVLPQIRCAQITHLSTQARLVRIKESHLTHYPVPGAFDKRCHGSLAHVCARGSQPAAVSAAPPL